jgi:hypothetical protein
MEAIHQTASTINNGLKYLQENSLVIVTCVAVLWVIRGRIMQWLDPSQQGVTLASSSNKKQDERLNDMMRVRQKQQEEAERQSKLAAQERKVKEAEEKKRRNELNLKKKKSESRGNTLGSNGSGYNPLQPWSSGSGGGYK